MIGVARQTINELPAKSRRMIFVLVFSLSLLSLLDVWSLSLLNATLAGTSSQSLFARWPSLVIVATLLIGKNILAAAANFVTQKKFEEFELQLGARNIEKFVVLGWSDKARYSKSDLLNLFDRSPYAAIQGVLAGCVTFVAEGVGALAILMTLFSASPLIATTVAIYFAVIFFIQNASYGKYSRRLGDETLKFSDESQAFIFDFHKLGKVLEIFSPDLVLGEIARAQRKLIPVRSKQRFIEAMPRYYVEAILVLGVGIIAAVAYLAQGAASVFGSLVLFAAGGYRLLPTLGRFQSSVSYANMNLELSLKCFDLPPGNENAVTEKKVVHGSARDVILRSVTFKYPGSDIPVLKDFSFRFERGKKYALVGPSGSGKTTLADICLGIWSPTSGSITIPSALRKAYVPQENSVLTGSLEKNVTLAESHEVKIAKYESALVRANLDKQILESKFLADGQLRLSGGQKQRLGLSRALYRNFDLLVLDEATSALDNKNERQVMDLIGRPLESQIFIVIAHRLSTILDADEILFIENGRLVASGNWSELSTNVPAFKTLIELGKLG